LSIDQKEKLFKQKLISSISVAVKILGDWKFDKKFIFEGIEKFSKTAEKQIKEQGGEIL